MVLQIPAIDSQNLSGVIEVSSQVFGQAFNETLVHQLVVKYLAGVRSGTKAQKSRSDVSGGGIKPWRQKGTGKARAGTTRGPIWRSGGVTFAARPTDHQQKINKKMYRVGIRSIFSELLRQGRLVVSDEVMANSTGKTKVLNQKLKVFNTKRMLLVTDKDDRNLVLAARNIPYLEVSLVEKVSPVSLINSGKIIMTAGALKRIEEYLA
jgi:large subunit ribosomal protein L4